MTILIKIVSRIIIGILWIRFAIRLLAISVGSGILFDLYRAGEILRAPFAGMFPDITIAGKFVLELNTLLAIVVYAIIELIIIKILSSRHHDEY